MKVVTQIFTSWNQMVSWLTERWEYSLKTPLCSATGSPGVDNRRAPIRHQSLLDADPAHNTAPDQRGIQRGSSHPSWPQLEVIGKLLPPF